MAPSSANENSESLTQQSLQLDLGSRDGSVPDNSPLKDRHIPANFHCWENHPFITHLSLETRTLSYAITYFSGGLEETSLTYDGTLWHTSLAVPTNDTSLYTFYQLAFIYLFLNILKIFSICFWFFSQLLYQKWKFVTIWSVTTNSFFCGSKYQAVPLKKYIYFPGLETQS